jgi:hypothetical protein
MSMFKLYSRFSLCASCILGSFYQSRHMCMHLHQSSVVDCHLWRWWAYSRWMLLLSITQRELNGGLRMSPEDGMA